jgi:4-amino-4-deoxy-L-arabinose transferase-like glycosyltransferase
VPYDSVSLLVAAVAGAVLAAAAVLRGSLAARIGLVLLAAFLIRMDAGWTRSLHEWDERFHALVAKNLLADPLTPTLYRNPAVEYDDDDWTANHVWLHKPPGALWLMAGSMAVFGVNEIAMRLPGVLLSCAAVWLTYLIGRLLFTPGIALLAAGFQAVNGFLVALAAGRRVADHVDTALIVFVELSVWAALRHARERRVPMLLLSGVALGAGLLTKSLPALLVVPIVFGIFVQQDSVSRAVAKCAVITMTGAAVAAPWMLHIWAVFPREAAAAGVYTLLHVSQTLEGHEPSLFAYVSEMPRFFGELVWIPLAAVAVAAVRDRAPELRMLLTWVGVPYVTFSMAKTQLPGYVMPAAPALFLIQAYFWFDLRRRITAMPRGWRRAGTTALLILLTALPARYLLEPTGSLERRDRNPAPFRELRTLESRLQLPDAVIFNMPTPIEAMFYSPYTAYRQMPTDDQIRRLTAQGRTVVIYNPDGTFGLPGTR